jgi:Tol biopolymer transport system component
VTDADPQPGAQARFTRVTNSARYDGRPTWTPDGRIAFGSVNTPAVRDRNILVVNQDGSGLTNLTTDPVWEDEPNWAPAQLSPPRSP